ncbi:MAG TPA: hypothetical protein VJT75_12715 [Thermoleophilaceae bacterium]|nr:hypothetical protein [Thermoleophilaceae bacterium]
MEHWEDQLRQAAFGAPARPAIVGISFGAQIAHALRLRQRVESREEMCVTLISHRHLTRGERRVLRGLSPDSRLAGYLVGETLLRLSETQVEDRDRLLALRDELYDDRRLVRARLVARLAALASAPPLEPAGDAATFVFGSEERTLRRRHQRHGGTALIVPGGHGVSIRTSPGLLGAVEKVISANPTIGRANGASR